MLAYETAHISSDYRVILLKDSAACHLLGNLFTLYAELNAHIQSHIFRANTQFSPHFNDCFLENINYNTSVVLIFASTIEDSFTVFTG